MTPETLFNTFLQESVEEQLITTSPMLPTQLGVQPDSSEAFAAPWTTSNQVGRQMGI
jgi:hypothetical protein